MAAAVQEAGRRAAAGAAVTRSRSSHVEASADRDRAGAPQGGRAGRAGAMEGAPPGGGGAPGAGGCAGGCDAGPLVNLDPGPGEPAARAAGAAAGSGAAGSRREDLGQLVGRGHLELVVAAILRLLVRPPAEEDGGVPEPVPLQVIVLHLAHPLDPERLPGEVLPRAPAALGPRLSVHGVGV